MARTSGAGTGGSSGVSSFNTRTGAVVPATGDYTVTEVTGAAPLASPALTGTPTAPTQGAGNNTTDIATTAFVHGNPGAILGGISYNPSGSNTYSTTSTSLVAIDSTNLAITFTAPPSGQVWVYIESYCHITVGSDGLEFGALSAGSQVGPIAVTVSQNAAYQRSPVTLLVPSLTVGNSYTFQAAWQVQSAATGDIFYGAANGAGGPVVFKVIAG